MAEVSKTVQLPEAAHALAEGLSQLIFDIIANHKADLNVTQEVTFDLTSAAKNLVPVLGKLGLIDDEAKADPLGVAQAFAIAGFEIGKKFYLKK